MQKKTFLVDGIFQIMIDIKLKLPLCRLIMSKELPKSPYPNPPPVVPNELPVPKMLTSLRTAAMGVLLIHLHIEMGASVWKQFPHLHTLPEDALACFVAAQCLPEGYSLAALRVLAERFQRLLLVYRQCRYAFHVFSVNVEAHVDDGGNPAILMALSSDRWPTCACHRRGHDRCHRACSPDGCTRSIQRPYRLVRN